MSMHNKPLSPVEAAGLIAHGFGRDIGRPSISADIFRLGFEWASMHVSDQVSSIKQMLDHNMPIDNVLRGRLADLLAEMTPAEVVDFADPDAYYLQNGFIGNTASFWRKNGAGYTSDLADAHVFTKEEAFRQHACRDEDVPILKSLVDNMAAPSVNVDRLRRALAEVKS